MKNCSGCGKAGHYVAGNEECLDCTLKWRGIEKVRLWEPKTSLPWRAVRGGTVDYLWYKILNSYGDEVFSTGGVRYGEEHDEVFRMICLTLVAVNDSQLIQINEKKFWIEWGAETKKLQEIG